MATSLRFSMVSQPEIDEVARLRDIHRGVLPMPDHPPGTVPEGPQEQAVATVVEKGLPRLVLVLAKSYIHAHTRRTKDGRTITVQSYFTKRVPKGEGPKKGRAPAHEPPPKGVYQAIRPEQLTARLVRHVREGKLTHAEAHANLEHLERRANAGHHLEHGYGRSWTPEQTHGFIAHARGRLKEHQEEQEQARQEEETRKQEAEKQRAEAERKKEDQRTKRRERRQRQKEREKQAKAEEAKQASDPMHADYSHIEDADAAGRLKAEKQFNTEHFANAPPMIAAALRKAPALRDVNPPGGTGSNYTRTIRTINSRPDPAYLNDADATWRHEYGHHIDYSIGEAVNTPGYHPKYPRLVRYGSGAQHNALEQDRKVLLGQRPPATKQMDAINAREQTLIDEGNRRGSNSQVKRDVWAAKGITTDDLEELFGPRGEQRAPLGTHAQLLIAWEQKDIHDFLMLLPQNNSRLGMAQDYFGAIMRNAKTFTFKHSDEYYQRDDGLPDVTTGYSQRHSAEAYADWLSMHGSGLPIYAKILEHFSPATNKAFMEMTHQWLTTTT